MKKIYYACDNAYNYILAEDCESGLWKVIDLDFDDEEYEEYCERVERGEDITVDARQEEWAESEATYNNMKLIGEVV